MSLWSLIVPETSINLVKNPSVEEATTGFTAIGGAISRVTLDLSYLWVALYFQS